jgi:hypothetical protein
VKEEIYERLQINERNGGRWTTHGKRAKEEDGKSRRILRRRVEVVQDLWKVMEFFANHDETYNRTCVTTTSINMYTML